MKRSPTVFPADPFDPEADADTLRKAMKGFGTDEKALLDVLARRTNEQRQQIAEQFKVSFGKDLVNDLKSETGGNFENILVALMTPLNEYLTRELHDALSGIGTDEEALIEIFCAMNKKDITVIKETYEKLYEKSVEDDIVSDTSGTFRRIMVSLCTANRDENEDPDHATAAADAQELLDAGELQVGTDESVFNKILCSRSYTQLELIFQEYEKLAGNSIEDAVKSEFSGASEDAFLAIIRSVQNRAEYFARRLHNAMSGAGTNDKQLIRIIVSRSEFDLGNIKEAYEAKYGKSLRDAVADDVSGDYRDCLITLLGDC